ncbi:MAG: hypothetical protein ABL964_17610 [Steroidobacteraceae bacterium]
MSSRSSPSIAIDCRPPAAARPVALLACVAAALIPWLAVSGPWTLPASLSSAAAVFGGFLLSGWLGGPRTLDQAVWSPEGVWWLTSRSGSGEVARLLPDSRVFTHWLWLRWDSPSGRRQALLPRRSVEADAVRRLATRLRLQGTQPATGSDSLPL